MQFNRRVIAIAVAGAASVALVAAAPALAASKASASAPVTGPEVIAGAVHGSKALSNNPAIPLRWQGVVTTASVIKLGGGSGPHKGSVKTLKSPAGNLTIKVTAKPTSSQAFNHKTCRQSFTEDIPVSVLGGKSTKAFAGSSGPGAVQIFFAASLPRFKSGPKKGQCNLNGRPKNAIASFLASLVLTLK